MKLKPALVSILSPLFLLPSLQAGEGVFYHHTTVGQLEWLEDRPDLNTMRPSGEPVFHVLVSNTTGDLFHGAPQHSERRFVSLSNWEISVSTSTADLLPEGKLWKRSSKGDVTSYRFRFAEESGPATKADFLRTKVYHYERLVRQPATGQRWFLYQAEKARKAFASEPVETRGELAAFQTARVPVPGRGFIDETMHFFSGGRAMSENLFLNEALAEVSSDGRDSSLVDIHSIQGITIEEMDWKALLDGSSPEIDALAAFIPADQHFVYVPSRKALRSIHQTWQSQLPELLTANPLVDDLADRMEFYLEQTGMGELRDLLEEGKVEGDLALALTGGDWFFLMGTDLAFVLQGEAVPELMTAWQEWATMERGVMATDELRLSKVEEEGWRVRELFSGKVRVVRNRQRSRSAYGVLLDDQTMLIANSPIQLERLAKVRAGEVKALSDETEYHFFRREMPKVEGEYAFAFFTDAAIRRWAGPQWRIGSSRQVRAHAALESLTALRLAGEELKEVPPFLGEVVPQKDRLQSETYGNLNFLTPVGEILSEKVHQEEANAYRRWRARYERRWPVFFDPIAWQVFQDGKNLRSRLAVVPLTAGSDYRQLMELTSGGSLPPGAQGSGEHTLLHFAMALDPESEFIERLRSDLAPMVPGAAEPLVRWIGRFVSLSIMDDPLWDALLKSGNPQRFMNSLGFLMNIPLGLQVESRDALSLTLFLSSLRAFTEQTAPGLLRWETRESAGRSYVRVGAADGIAGESLALYYAPTPEALIVSFQEEGLLRQLEAGEADQVEESPMGQHLLFSVERKFLEVAQKMTEAQFHQQQTHQLWRDLPLLTEWRRVFPDEDPVAFHERYWGRSPHCPADGEYLWNEEIGTMESSVTGSPFAPRDNVKPRLLTVPFGSLAFGLTFAHDGVFIEALMEPPPEKKSATVLEIDPLEWVFPLQEGTRLKYRFRESGTPGSEVEEETITRVEDLGDGRVEWETAYFDTATGEAGREVFRIDEEGWVQVSWEDEEFRDVWTPPMMVLPRRLVQGETKVFPTIVEGFESDNGGWESEAREEEISYMVYQGVETVEVEAGTFDCLKIRVAVHSDDGEIRTYTEWFARGVGWVKFHTTDEFGWFAGELVAVHPADEASDGDGERGDNPCLQ